jgi:hypothetical protein
MRVVSIAAICIAYLNLIVDSVISLSQDVDRRQSIAAVDDVDGQTGDEVKSGRKADRRRAVQKIAEGSATSLVIGSSRGNLWIYSSRRVLYSDFNPGKDKGNSRLVLHNRTGDSGDALHCSLSAAIRNCIFVRNPRTSSHGSNLNWSGIPPELCPGGFASIS